MSDSSRVFIGSPWRGDVVKNGRNAQRLIKHALKKGYAPFAPHLIYPQVLNDDDPGEREAGINAGLSFLKTCNEAWVYAGAAVSAGMAIEIKFFQSRVTSMRLEYTECGIPFYRYTLQPCTVDAK